MTQTTLNPRICPFCEQNCGVIVEVDPQAQSIVSVRGDKDDPFSKGYICPKAYAHRP
jgi:anaerobic selenocysteine-containing dehydrogenase